MPDNIRDPKCLTEETLPTLVGPPSRPEPPCDPPEPVTPDVFVEPGAEVPYEDLPILPIGATTLTVEVTVTCADSPTKAAADCTAVRPLVGAASTASFSQDFQWELITGLTDNQRRYLAALSQETRDTAATMDAADLEYRFKLHEDQAAEVAAGFQALQANTEAKARLSALAALDCAWWNAAYVALCPDGAVEAPAGDYEPVRTATVDAGVFSSELSPCAADEAAQAAALAALRCVYTNTEVTVHCFDDPAFPTDEEGAVPRRVGTVTIEAGKYFSTTSMQAATDMATAIALSALSCFYLNKQKSAKCKNDTEGNAPWQKNPSNGTAMGNPVTIAAGSIISEISQDAADQEAQTLANSLLDCFFTVEVTATCPTSPDPDDAASPVEASQTMSPRYSVTIPAGVVVSPVSQKAAYDTAMLMAKAQLECLYCNKEMLPRCTPASQMTKAPIATSVDRTGWSLSATSGVAAGTFCAPTYEAAKALAEAIGNIPMDVQTTAVAEQCIYGNDEIKAACVISTSEASDTTVSKFVTTKSFVEFGLSAESTPNPYNATRRFVYVAANTMTVAVKDIPDTFRTDLKGDTDAWGKAYANDLAKRQAESFLNCYWSNEQLVVKCRADLTKGTPSGSAPSRTITYGDGLMQDGSKPSGSAIAAVVVTRNQFISFTSQDEANAAAASMGISQLNCFVGNQAMMLLCGATLNSDSTGTSASGYITYGDNTMPDGSSIFNEEDTTLRVGKTVVTVQKDYYGENNSGPVAMWMRTEVNVTTTTKSVPIVVNKKVVGNTVYNKVIRTTTITYYEYDGTTVFEQVYDPSESWVNLNLADPAVLRVLVPSDSFISYESLEAANFMAKAAGLGGLVCYAKNDAQWGDCQPENAKKRIEKVAWAKLLIPTYKALVKALQTMYDAMPAQKADPKTGKVPEDPAKDALKNMLDKFQSILNGLENPLGRPAFRGFVEAKTVMSLISVADANSQAKVLAQAASQCLVGNDLQLSSGGASPSADGGCTPGCVPPDTVLSFNREAANTTGATLAEALSECNGGGGGGNGLPGNDGAQTSCEGQCAAYYS